jgi:acyl-[acyl-carrier-protein]-phospholipid O-acyltransferase/long-chain-fatty-acid--[acyl-carrier-protein] ligase
LRVSIAFLIAGVAVATLVSLALWQVARLRLSFMQGLLYAPLKTLWRIDDAQIAAARRCATPVIYAIVHRSRLDPALMLSLLPEETLHILDEESATASWLEPYRSLAPTIAFNAEHVFVSRRLVRRLRAGGRLAVYIPDAVEPDQKSFRLYRAIARIASQADARIVAIDIGEARHLPFSLTPAHKAPRRQFPRLRIRALEGRTLTELAAQAGENITPRAHALFDRIAEARVAAGDRNRTLFFALRDAADRFGPGRIILEDPVSGVMSYRRLFVGARLLGRRFRALGKPGDAIGLMLPNANAMVAAFLGIQSAGRIAAMINYSSGPTAIASAFAAADIRTVVSSRAFIEKADLKGIVDTLREHGTEIVWLEDLRESAGPLAKLSAALMWRRPLCRSNAEDPAIVLFTSGSEGRPKGVLLSHRNVVINALQAEARVDISPTDTLFNVLPAFHCFGLTGGTLLPLLSGIRLYLYPSPLHYKIVPQMVAKVRPTILFGTDTFLAAYARTAADGDFSSLRLVVAGAEAVKAETRKTWRERFGAEILEGYGMTEAAPVVAVNSLAHGREGTVGRLLPGMRMRIEPVEGLEGAGRLWLCGPNIMLGYMTAEEPGKLQRLAGEWHDSGDIVSVDREGFITIRGRARRFAKLAGEMVSLGLVEMLAQELWPDGRHAALAVEDKRKGERIVLMTTHPKPDRAAFARHARKAGASELSVPSDYVTVDDIPLLGSGKTDYVEASRRLAELLQAAA